MTKPADAAGSRSFAERLPVDDIVPALRAALASGTSAVIQAPPGAGKTTHIPIALLGESWLRGSKVLMLEPRRLAARAVTHRMAQLLGERAGDTVGYRVRRDTRVGPETRIEVVTEGVLTRMLQKDPTLDGVGLVIFDEFHERSIHADTGLALALHSRQLVRPDLRIVVMSATLDGARVAALLDGAPIISSEGRTYPVELIYSPRPDARSLVATVAAAIKRAVASDDGDILVFLPGGAEIRRVASLLDGSIPNGVRVEHLYGDLSQQAQDAAVARAADGSRKIVLSTPIAETSLTIEGVRVVIDSGLARAPRFSPRSGMTRLETVRISRSSADQRAGRAGRTTPGKCYRLWPEVEQHHLLQHATPEILQADLASLVLELAVAGIHTADELRWLDAPPLAARDHARELLLMLGAIDESNSVTMHGRAMAALPVHPRIAHMLIASVQMNAGAVGCDVAALLEDRDFVRGVNGPADADIAIRLELLSSEMPHASVYHATVDHAVRRRIAAESKALARQLNIPRGVVRDSENVGAVLALAYPDRIGQARQDAMDGRFLLRNGRGAALTHPQALSSAQYIVAAELDGDARSARIFLGASLSSDEVDVIFADQIQVEDVVEWEEQSQSVRAYRRRTLGAIILSESVVTGTEVADAPAVMLNAIRRNGIATLPWSDAATRLRERIRFMRTRRTTWPDVSDEALAATLDQWLPPILEGQSSLRGLEHELDRALLGLLDWQQRGSLDSLAPAHYVAPTGTRVAIDYRDPEAPSISVRLQEMFGVAETPTVDAGAVRLTVQLLSPARRPVQVTRDLAGFWTGSYFDVRKDLRGRYPKHVWPDDPLAEPPTARAKRKAR